MSCSSGKRCEPADNGIFEEEDARVRMTRRLHNELKIVEEEDKDLWSLFVQAIHVVEQLEHKINDLCQRDEPSGVQSPADVATGNSVNRQLRAGLICRKRFHKPALVDGAASDRAVNADATLHYENGELCSSRNVTCGKFQERKQNLSPETWDGEKQIDVVQNCTDRVNQCTLENECDLNGIEDISDKQAWAELMPKDGASSVVGECCQTTSPQEDHGTSVYNNTADKELANSEEQVHHNVKNTQNKDSNRSGICRFTDGVRLSDKATARNYGNLSKNLSRSEADVRNGSNLSRSRTVISKLPTFSRMNKQTISRSTVDLSSKKSTRSPANNPETTANQDAMGLSKNIRISKKLNISHVNDTTTDQVGMGLSEKVTSTKNLESRGNDTTKTSICNTEEESYLNTDDAERSDTNSAAQDSCPTKHGGNQPVTTRSQEHTNGCDDATEKLNNTEAKAAELATVTVGADASKSPSKLTTASRLPTPKFGKTKRLSKSEIDISKISKDSNNVERQLNLDSLTSNCNSENSLHYNEISKSTTDLTMNKTSLRKTPAIANNRNSVSCIAINMLGRKDNSTGKPRSRTGSLLGAIEERSESHRRRLSDNCLQMSGISRIPHMRRPSVPSRTPGDELRHINDIHERYSGIRPPTITNRIQKWERHLGHK